jgi:Family of unknown function (DUF5330)
MVNRRLPSRALDHLAGEARSDATPPGTDPIRQRTAVRTAASPAMAQILGNHISSNCVKIFSVFSSIMGKNVSHPRTSFSTPPASLRADAVVCAAGDVGVMFFLLRVAFWLGVVLILLPSGFLQPSAPTSDVGAADAISAASATVEDLRGFCTRQPDACSVGSHMATAIGYKAQAGAKMLYDVLTEALAPHDTGALTRGAGNGGDAKSTQAKSAQQASQSTLTPADLLPAWRGPQRKDGKRAV